jgi:hypothetical protein
MYEFEVETIKALKAAGKYFEHYDNLKWDTISAPNYQSEQEVDLYKRSQPQNCIRVTGDNDLHLIWDVKNQVLIFPRTI